MRVPATSLLVSLVGWLAACSHSQLPTTPTPEAAATPEPPSLLPAAPVPPVAASNARRTIIGTIRAVNGGPLGDVAIHGFTSANGSYGRIGVTASDGSFRVSEFSGDGIWFRRDGYETGFWRIPQGTRADETFVVSLRVQPAIIVIPDSSVSTVITHDDLTCSDADGYLIDNLPFYCSPCKIISLVGAAPGAVLRLSWVGSNPPAIWAGQYYGGVHVHKAGRPDESTLVVPTPLSFPMDTIFVGFGVDRHDPRTLSEPVAVTVAVENP